MMRCFKLGKKESDIMTKSNTSNIGMRMDSNLKTAADKLHEELGRKINLVALPCLCVDVFDGTDELRAGGEALNFAAHASKFDEFNVSILGAVGQDSYAKFIMDSISDKRIDVSHVRIDKDKETANNRTYLTDDGDRYYKDDSWTGDIIDNMILNHDELEIIKKSDVVFVHFWAGCFGQIIDLKKITTSDWPWILQSIVILKRWKNMHHI